MGVSQHAASLILHKKSGERVSLCRLKYYLAPDEISRHSFCMSREILGIFHRAPATVRAGLQVELHKVKVEPECILTPLQVLLATYPLFPPSQLRVRACIL